MGCGGARVEVSRRHILLLAPLARLRCPILHRNGSHYNGVISRRPAKKNTHCRGYPTEFDLNISNFYTVAVKVAGDAEHHEEAAAGKGQDDDLRQRQGVCGL